jgi:hypothetical protein
MSRFSDLMRRYWSPSKAMFGERAEVNGVMIIVIIQSLQRGSEPGYRGGRRPTLSGVLSVLTTDFQTTKAMKGDLVVFPTMGNLRCRIMNNPDTSRDRVELQITEDSA